MTNEFRISYRVGRARAAILITANDTNAATQSIMMQHPNARITSVSTRCGAHRDHVKYPNNPYCLRWDTTGTGCCIHPDWRARMGLPDLP